MMKKLLIYLLLAAMILTFVACKENDDPKADEKDAYVFLLLYITAKYIEYLPAMCKEVLYIYII